MTDDKTKQKAIEAAADIYGIYLIHTYIYVLCKLSRKFVSCAKP
jgi:hypothetical protein